ncbi:MAG: putative endonuclease [Gammaproteobacteria bacterium]|jgi:putative endonuclease
MDDRRNLGAQFENKACQYLATHGLILIEGNFHSRFGEIDLIMSDKDQICFIEVKYRKNKQFGGVMESIGQRKRNKIIKTAQFFIATNHKFRNHSFRFDALLLQPDDSAGNLKVNWIQNAFYAE